MFESRLPHCWSNDDKAPVRALLVLVPTDERDVPSARHFMDVGHVETAVAQVAAAIGPPIKTAHPLAREFPLAIGATWVYVIERDDECAGKGSARVVQGAITETVVAAWQAGDAEVYQLDVRTEMHGLSQRRQDHYVILNDALYRVPASPEHLLRAGGEGFEAMQVCPGRSRSAGRLGRRAEASARGRWCWRARRPARMGSTFPATCCGGRLRIADARPGTARAAAWCCCTCRSSATRPRTRFGVWRPSIGRHPRRHRPAHPGQVALLSDQRRNCDGAHSRAA